MITVLEARNYAAEHNCSLREALDALASAAPAYSGNTCATCGKTGWYDSQGGHECPGCRGLREGLSLEERWVSEGWSASRWQDNRGSHLAASCPNPRTVLAPLAPPRLSYAWRLSYSPTGREGLGPFEDSNRPEMVGSWEYDRDGLAGCPFSPQFVERHV